MQQAVQCLTLIPDTLSSGMFQECAAPEDARMETLHARLNRLRTLIGTLRDVDYEDDRVDDILGCIEHNVDGLLMLSGDEARLVNAMPHGMDPVWNRPSYRGFAEKMA